MIRVTGRDEHGDRIYGATRKGLALLGAGFGVLVATAILAALGFSRANDVGSRNCQNIATIGKIQRRLIEGQTAQTNALIATGYTFGIPRPRLEIAVAANQKLQARFLHELDELSHTTC